MTTVPFKNLPPTLRVPLFYAELDASQANTAVANQRALIIGQITAAGLATPNVPLISSGPGDAVTQGGPGSMLALMTAAYRQNDSFGELWYLPLADASAATAAAGSIAFTASPTVAGTLALYIAGVPVMVPVTAGQAASALAQVVANAINGTAPSLPVTAVAASGTVTLTALNKGAAGNDVDIRVNYRGTTGGEATPPGLAFTITTMSGGATNPTLATALGNLQDKSFDFIVCPYTDTASLDALKAFLNDQTGRWSYQQQVYGHVFCAYRATWAGLTTLGVARNNQHESIMGFYDSPSPNFVWAAALAGASAVSLRADPGVPLQTLQLAGVLAPPLQSRFSLSQRNTLLYDGISTFTVQAGTVAIENLITTYQLNSFGQPDNSYLEVETLFQLMLELRTLASLITTKYARVKLAADGVRVDPNSGLVTPSIIKADLIALYQEREALGYVQNSAAFAKALVVQKNASNPNRVDVLWPGTPVNQLRIFALLVQFRSQ